MSRSSPANEPVCLPSSSPSIELVVEARPRDVRGLAVRRALPSIRRRLVGPFIFFDHIGPAEMPVGTGIDVRPHPHIALATVTYLFDGEIVHRDSLGSLQAIRPGDVNWMVAGRGVAHSERSSPEARQRGGRLHGIQSWVALPLENEEVEPSFEHHPTLSIPSVPLDGARVDVIAGTAFGVRSPVRVLSPTLYVHARLDAGARLSLDTEHEERAFYVVEGTLVCDGESFRGGNLVVLRSGVAAMIEASQPARAMIVGGAKLAGERHVWWNFVSSSKERIERAKDDWKSGRFPKVAGDDAELIPLPES